MLEDLTAAWAKHEPLLSPPAQPIVLFQTENMTIFVDQSWGPPVPYPPSPRGSARTNHGYVRLKGNLAAAASISEVIGWPEYQRFLERINEEASPIESVGCEKGHFPTAQGEARAKVGSYTHIIFSKLALNQEPLNFIRLAAALSVAMEGSMAWWSTAEIGLQRSRRIQGCERPWCLLLRIAGLGRTPDEARRTWGHSIDRMGTLIEGLPVDFPGSTK